MSPAPPALRRRGARPRRPHPASCARRDAGTGWRVRGALAQPWPMRGARSPERSRVRAKVREGWGEGERASEERNAGERVREQVKRVKRGMAVFTLCAPAPPPPAFPAPIQAAPQPLLPTRRFGNGSSGEAHRPQSSGSASRGTSTSNSAPPPFRRSGRRSQCPPLICPAPRSTHTRAQPPWPRVCLARWGLCLGFGFGFGFWEGRARGAWSRVGAHWRHKLAAQTAKERSLLCLLRARARASVCVCVCVCVWCASSLCERKRGAARRTAVARGADLLRYGRSA